MAWVIRTVWAREWRAVGAGLWVTVPAGHVLNVAHGGPLVVDGVLRLDGVVRVSNV